MKISDFTNIKDWITILVGCTILAAGFVFFINPYNLVPGGVYGLSIVVHNFLPQLQVGTISYIFEVPLEILMFVLLGSKMSVRTVVAALITPLIMNGLSVLVYPDAASLEALDPTKILGGRLDLSNHLILTTTIGAAVVGLGQGLVARTQSTGGGTDIVAMATCAAREAPNRQELVDAAAECGIRLQIIPGREEARLVRLGVAGPDCARRTLCIDVGGGSTEIALAEGKDDLYLDSLNLSYFVYTIHKNKTCIFHQGRLNPQEKLILDRMKGSPYRSYLEGEIYDASEIVYYKIIAKDSTISDLEACLRDFIAGKSLRTAARPQSVPGISGLYIYASTATLPLAEQRMMDRLRAREPGLRPVEIFAPRPYRTEHDAMHLLHRVGNAYEPVALFGRPLFRNKLK